MPELVLVMVLTGLLAVYALPKLSGMVSMRDDAWHDQVQAALRFAQKGAVARRRLTCVSVANLTVTVSTAAANPATTCSSNLPGPDGQAAFARSDNPGMLTSVSPSGVLYFQPDGRVTSDGAGDTAQDFTITMSGAANVLVRGQTGYVE